MMHDLYQIINFYITVFYFCLFACSDDEFKYTVDNKSM